MIAIAILSAALIPLLALQSQFVRSVESFERAEIRLEDRDNALNYLKTLNFHQYETGEIELGSSLLQWEAIPAGASQMSRAGGGGEGRYEMTLYDVTATIYQVNGAMDQFTVRGIGWRPTRPFILLE